jgi:hypothetical protein
LLVLKTSRSIFVRLEVLKRGLKFRREVADVEERLEILQ